MRLRCLVLMPCLALACRGPSKVAEESGPELAPYNLTPPAPVDEAGSGGVGRVFETHQVKPSGSRRLDPPYETAPTPAPPARNVAQTVSRPEIVRARHESPAPPADNGLDLAAACIEKGDQAGAAEHLRRHVRAHPEQVMIRAYLAELLLKLKRLPEAQDQFERFVADAQDREGPPRKHVLHCHTRLMEIAQDRGDEYGEHLYRAIGLVLLARQLDAGAGEGVEPGFRERLLCRAAAELTTARKLRPDEPRPHWYLVEVWTKLDQPRPAERALKQAKALAALVPLPPAEQRALVAAP